MILAQETVEKETTNAPTRPSVGIRYLTPSNTEIFRGRFNLLHAKVLDEESGAPQLYVGVYAVLAFPVSAPGRFVSLRHRIKGDREEEIWIIAELSKFPEGARRLVRESLANHYFEFIVSRIKKVEWRYGLLFFDVETQFGPKQFEMFWRQNRAEDYGERGKVLLDTFKNRFVIRDIEALPEEDKKRLTRYIYW